MAAALGRSGADLDGVFEAGVAPDDGACPCSGHPRDMLDVAGAWQRGRVQAGARGVCLAERSFPDVSLDRLVSDGCLIRGGLRRSVRSELPPPPGRLTPS